MKKSSILILIFSFLPSLYSSEIIQIHEEQIGESIYLKECGAWLYDPETSFLIDDIQYKSFHDTTRVDFGFLKKPLWLKYPLESNAALPLLLHTNWGKAKQINVFLKSEHCIQEIMQNFSFRKPAFDINIPKGTSTLYIAIQSEAPIYVDFRLSTSSSFFNQIYPEEIFLAFWFGVIAVIALYNLFVFISSRDINYLYYFFYLLFLFMYQLSVEGYASQFLWGNDSWFALRSYNVFISCVFTFGVVFTSSYLELKSRHEILYQTGQILKILFILTGVLFLLFFESWLMPLGNFCILSGVVYFLTCGIVLFRKGFKPARFFITAWSFLMIGTFITTAKRLHWLPYTFFTQYALHMGSMLESVLLALALGDRVQFINDKKIEAEEALVDANREIMQDRMRPHFLFNSMNIIFNQLREDPKAAQNTLQNLSDNYHYLTETKGKKILPFSKEWHFLENYLSLMQQRWPDQLYLDISCSQELDHLPFPPLTLQPLAENAFKYALRHLNNKSLNITGEVVEKLVHITIKHPAFSPLGKVDYSRSLGNIKNRINKYYPDAELLLFQEADVIITLLTFTYPGD